MGGGTQNVLVKNDYVLILVSVVKG
jgi:hypothetical protein